MLFFYDATLLNNCAIAILSHYDRQSYSFFGITPILKGDFTDYRERSTLIFLMYTPILRKPLRLLGF